MKKDRATYMNASQTKAMGEQDRDNPQYKPRTHQTCKELTGVSRPGKTAKDKAGSATLSA